MPLREPSWAVAVGSRQEAARVLEAAQAHNEDDEVDCKQQARQRPRRGSGEQVSQPVPLGAAPSPACSNLTL